METYAAWGLLAQADAVTAGDGWSPAVQWGLTGAVIALALAGLVAFNYLTRAGIVARATTKEVVRQPIFLLLLALALVMLVLLTFLPYFSLGEDIKMLKDCGLATLLFCGLLLAVWSSSTSIAAEIEGKTTMTLLSKPINRRQFVLGKYFGILQSVLWLLLPLSVAFVALIYFKVGYDARESGGYDPLVHRMFDWASVSGRAAWLANGLPVAAIAGLGLWATLAGRRATRSVGFWTLATLVTLFVAGRVALRLLRGLDELPVPAAGPRIEETIRILPALLLIGLEATVLTAVSVALSTRLPMVLNMVSCLAIFIVGHLTPVLVKTVFEQLEPVKFTAQLIATVLPSLEAFNTQSAVAKSTIIPPEYLGLSALYCAAYSTAAILLAFILFEDRDLA
ncbi:MAG TPA: ABC transporter permease [Planctomycetaceae bacterium]|nr:ABC transporter permease [Planctomycetaceae bacterium]